MRNTVACLLAAALVTPSWARAGEPDYQQYERLLGAHISVLRQDGRPVASGFDYEGLRARPRSAEVMHAIRRQLLAVPPSRMSSTERQAWAINLYNFLVIDGVVAHCGADGKGPSSVRDVPGFFDQPVVEVEGQSYSLNAFERHFLFADYDPKSKAPRPPALDPRNHFAIVCAARGCPPLAGHPYRALGLSEALDRAVRDALERPSQLRIDPKTGRFAISSVFDWYVADFGGRAGVAEFLGRYASPSEAAVIRKRRAASLDGFIPWDWTLNQVPGHAAASSP